MTKIIININESKYLLSDDRLFLNKESLINNLYIIDPKQTKGSDRVIRGGSWVNDAQVLRSGYRNFGVPGLRYDDVGFRLLRTKKLTHDPFTFLPSKTNSRSVSEMEFVKIPKNTCQSDNGYKFIITNDFELQTTPVTQKQWISIMNSNPSKFVGKQRPVEQVSWDEAQEFIEKLNTIDDGYTYRLPTEHEWELACADTKVKDGAWHASNSKNSTQPVAQLKPNKYGLYDMLGNVWEMCLDYYEDLSKYKNDFLSDDNFKRIKLQVSKLGREIL